MGRFSWIGIGLILAGAAMLLDRLDVVQIGWIVVLWTLLGTFGLTKAVDGFNKKKSGRIFWGTFLFLLGLYKVLKDLDIIELRSYWLVPALVLIGGFSMLMVYLSSPREWHLLVPAILLLGTGTVIVLAELGYLFRYDVIEAFRTYWPVGLIAFGLAIVVRKLSPRSST